MYFPVIVAEFIKKIKINADYKFAVATYGNMSQSCLYEFEKIAEQSNIYFDYTNEIVMIDNFLPLFKIENQLRKEAQKNIEVRINAIISDIQNRKKYFVRKGIMSKILSNLIGNGEKKKKGNIDKHFYVNENCIRCKMCQYVCPKNNIVLDNNPHYKHNCIYCLSCINNCPKTAIHLDNEKSSSRFRNSNIDIKEIIAANKQ